MQLKKILPVGLLAALTVLPQVRAADGGFTGEPGAGETAAAVPTAAPKTFSGKYKLLYGAQREGRRTDAAMQRFRDNRVGALVCWGLFSVPGGVWKGKTYGGAAEWIQQWARIPKDEYRALMKQWNPTNFDARKWAKFFKHMGLKYIKITTKFHDGFCLWPSAYSDFTVANTPYKKDLLGEIVKACNDEGIDVHFYYSVLEWNHPDWRYSVKTPEDKAAMERFLKYEENQLRELATRYPTVKDFWFDGTWDASVRANGRWTYEMEKMLKKLVPGVTVNSRLRADDRGRRHFDSNGRMMGDYESGYERKLPDPRRDFQVTERDWEACMTLPVNQWGYHRDWSLSYVKSPAEVLERVVHAVSMGGNMAIDLGPKPDGTFREEEQALADCLGAWMKTNGSAVYGCGYAGLAKQDWGYYTLAKDGSIHMIVFNPPYSGRLPIVLPRGKSLKPTAEVLGGGTVRLTRVGGSEWMADVPSPRPEGPFVIRLIPLK